jgi:DNA replication ATP-dependent helicase Dna2
VGEAINASVEPDMVALARGFIVELTPYKVVVGVDHELYVEATLEGEWTGSVG